MHGPSNDTEPNHNMEMRMYFSSQSFSYMVPFILFSSWRADSNVSRGQNIIEQYGNYRTGPNRAHNVALTLIKPLAFASQVTMGYFIMFILMSYNFGLCFVVVLGNVIGYILFTSIFDHYEAKQQLTKWKREQEVSAALVEQKPIEQQPSCHDENTTDLKSH